MKPGDRLGPYEIIAPIGAGGMGEVYRARDTRLGRDVAIKVLPAEFASDPDRLRRFEQEARAVAALDHPNILAIHDVGTHEGAPYLVTELLEGETLRDRIQAGPLPPRKAVEIGVHIAQGLAAAHEKGIVHRDLKPGNVFVTRDGQVKILDFGLAKLTQPETPSDPYAKTASGEPSTESGTVLGTMGYTSPEQLRGERADARSDIFSFGCVLYEMLAGRSPFLKATGAETVTAIMSEDPAALSGTGRAIAPALQEIVSRCLEKRPEDRFSSAHDLALALRATRSDAGEAAPSRPVVSGRSRARKIAWVAAALAVVVAAVVWLRFGRPAVGRQGGADFRKVMVGEFENMTGDPALQPVGRMVAEAVSQGLAELGDVEVVAPPPNEANARRLDDSALRVAAKAAGAGTLVSGSTYLDGGELEVRGRVSDVASGKLLYVLKPETAPRNAPAQAVDRVRQRVMGAMLLRSGEAPALGGVTVPPLYSAYQEYIAGSSMMGVDAKAVFAHLERAAAIDPEFWHPQIRLMAWYRMVGDTARYEAARRRLQENQDKLGPADRVLLQYYDAQLGGRTLEAYRKARELLALAPRDFTLMFGAANLAMSLNRPREALECLGDVEKINWRTLGHWTQGTWLLDVAAFSHHLLGEHDAELAVADLGLRLYPDMLNIRADRARALAALGRPAEVDRTIAESLTIRSQLQTPSDVMLTAAEELRAHGHADDARRVAVRCVEWLSGLAGDEAKQPSFRLDRVECLWLAERWEEAGSLADTLAKDMPASIPAIGYHGALAARSGDRTVAAVVDKALAARTEERAIGLSFWARACIAAQLGERDEAVRLLREALSHGFTDLRSLHVYVFLEPLHGYPPFEELIRPKG
jgi:tetratricopeptide (TPR) repeat protein/TolB-like protein